MRRPSARSMQSSSRINSLKPLRHLSCWSRYWNRRRAVEDKVAGEEEGSKGDPMFYKLLFTGILATSLVLAQGRGGAGGGMGGGSDEGSGMGGGSRGGEAGGIQ